MSNLFRINLQLNLSNAKFSSLGWGKHSENHRVMDFDLEMDWPICFLNPTYLPKSYSTFRVQLKYILLPDTQESNSFSAIKWHTSISSDNYQLTYGQIVNDFTYKKGS